MVSKVKIRRVELGLKQKEVAEKIGITPQYLMCIENGKAKNPSIEIMKKLSAVLCSSPEELFFKDVPVIDIIEDTAATVDNGK